MSYRKTLKPGPSRQQNLLRYVALGMLLVLVVCMGGAALGAWSKP